LELRQFFFKFFPIADLDQLREQAFGIVYTMEGGVQYRDVMGDNPGGMSADERRWWLARITKQLKKEAAAVKKK
jgi:hypothetical protein